MTHIWTVEWRRTYAGYRAGQPNMRPDAEHAYEAATPVRHGAFASLAGALRCAKRIMTGAGWRWNCDWTPSEAHNFFSWTDDGVTVEVRRLEVMGEPGQCEDAARELAKLVGANG